MCRRPRTSPLGENILTGSAGGKRTVVVAATVELGLRDHPEMTAIRKSEAAQGRGMRFVAFSGHEDSLLCK
jgi:hypothetical protein